MYQYVVALDLAQERTREAERAAALHRLLRDAGNVRGDAQPPHPKRVRSLVAAPVRAFGNATHAVSETTHAVAHAASAAATRLEGA